MSKADVADQPAHAVHSERCDGTGYAGRADRAIPSLDGLRALAVIGVIVDHAVSHDPTLFPKWSQRPLVELGPLGVRIFFVISGYLITTLLLRDLDAVGHVRLGRFYLRRVLRIFPPFYAYLMAVGIATVHGSIPHAGRWWPAWLYLTNFAPTQNWYTGHSWSLAVEEQFYLTWPFVLAWMGRERGRRVAIGVCLVMPLCRVLTVLVTGNPWVGANVAFDFLAFGCLLALSGPNLIKTDAWTRSRAAVLAVVTLVLLGIALAGVPASVELAVLEGAEAATIALGVAWCVANPTSPFGRLLNTRSARIVGVGSYSIYLWQQVFFGPGLPSLTVPGAIVATGVAATASYFMIERPALAFRSRLERWAGRLTVIHPEVVYGHPAGHDAPG